MTNIHIHMTLLVIKITTLKNKKFSIVYCNEDFKLDLLYNLSLL
jgi:hypothetical protein